MNKNIRIMLVSPLPPPAGGDSTWAFKYLRFAKENNLNIYHVNTSLIGKRAETASDDMNLRDELLRTKHIWKQIRTTLKKNIQIVHFNSNCSKRGLMRDFISVSIIAHKKIPIIFHCRCNVSDQIKNSKIALYFFKRISKKIRIFFVQNNSSFKFVSSHVKTRVVIMPNYIESSFLIFKNKPISKRIKSAIFVGHIRKTKGIDELLNLSAAYPNIEFRLAGPITSDYSVDFFEKYSNVFLCGSLDSELIVQELDNSDVFIFPTYTEGFSNALLEAMSRGMPIITTDVGSNLDMLENAGGIIIQPKNSQQLIDAFDSIQPFDIRNSMSLWNVKKVMNCYTIENVFKKMYSFYEELINENNY